MKSVSHLAVVGLFAFTTAAPAEESSTPSSEIRHVIARADADDIRGAIQSASFDDYVGRYESANGDIVIFPEDGALMIELAESSALPPTRLHAVDRVAFTTDTEMRVTFRADASGRIEGVMVIAADGQMSVSAVKMPSLRGFVTIHDLEPTPPPSRRGFVTIHDIDTATPQVLLTTF